MSYKHGNKYRCNLCGSGVPQYSADKITVHLETTHRVDLDRIKQDLKSAIATEVS